MRAGDRATRLGPGLGAHLTCRPCSAGPTSLIWHPPPSSPLQAEELSRRLQAAQGEAAAASAEAAQLQEILDVKSDRLAALEAEAAVRQQRLEVQDAGLAAAESELAALRGELVAARAAEQTQRGAVAGGHGLISVGAARRLVVSGRVSRAV